MAIHPGIFRQYDIRGVTDRDLTPEVARAIVVLHGTGLHRKEPLGGPLYRPLSAEESP